MSEAAADDHGEPGAPTAPAADPAIDPAREIALPAGDSVVLRPQAESDAGFVRGLFLTIAARGLGLESADGMEPLLEIQWRSREAGYAAAWPAARRWVIEHDGSPVGSLIEGRTGAALHVVDISLTPQMQGHGLGSAVIADLQARAAEAGLAVTANILVGNVASLALFRGRGFTGSIRDGEAQIGVRWAA